MRKWETFKNMRPAVKQPRVTISTGGTVHINFPAFILMGEPEAVLLLFDRQTNEIGLQPVKAKILSARAVKKQKRSRNWVISTKAFLNHYGVDYSRKVDLRMTIENDIVILSA